MRLETILNKCLRHKSFVYQSCRFEVVDGKESIVIGLAPRKNGLVLCSKCQKRAPIYDKLSTRRFTFVPLWGIPVYFEYQMRRVTCSKHDVTVEYIPWGDGKSNITKVFGFFLASWAKKMSWKEVAETFGVSWDTVYKAVSAIVEYGLAHRDLDGITAIGVDEIQYKKGHNYLTLVYQIDACSRRLLFIGKDRTAKTLLRFFREFGQERTKNLKFVCSDMWKPYLKVIRKKAINALNILDRFHIVKKLNEAVDKVRREEVYKAKKDGFTATKLKKTKYCFLKNKENLTVNQQTRLNDIIKCDFASVKAYFLKEAFRHFWSYTTWRWAEWFLDKWCDEVTDSGLEPLCGFVNTLNKHRHLIENWFKAKKAYSSGIVEGLNRKINLVTRKSYGFRTEKVLEIALFHTMGDLPEPKFPHKFL